MTQGHTKSIASLRKAIKFEIDELEGKIAALRLEDDALATAERVAARYSGQIIKPPVDLFPELPLKQNRDRKTIRGRGGSPRPKGVPTLPEMITFAIRSALKEGKPGLTLRPCSPSVIRRKRFFA